MQEDVADFRFKKGAESSKIDMTSIFWYQKEIIVNNLINFMK